MKLWFRGRAIDEMQNKQIIVTSPVKFFLIIYSHKADCQIFYNNNNIISKTRRYK